jgi:sec-independent protein translocase protein TatB
MFDIGFWELTLIGIIALLVIGPDRLPGVARNVGMWVGRIRRYVSQVRADIEREIQAEEVKKLIDKPSGLESLYDVVEETKGTLREAGDALTAAQAEVSQDVSPAAPTSASEGTDAGAGADGERSDERRPEQG